MISHWRCRMSMTSSKACSSPGDFRVHWIELYPDASIAHGVCGREGRPGSGEWIKDNALPEWENRSDNLPQELLWLQRRVRRQGAFSRSGWMRPNDIAERLPIGNSAKPASASRYSPLRRGWPIRTRRPVACWRTSAWVRRYSSDRSDPDGWLRDPSYFPIPLVGPGYEVNPRIEQVS